MNLNIIHRHENNLNINCEGYDENLLQQRIYEYQSCINAYKKLSEKFPNDYSYEFEDCVKPLVEILFVYNDGRKRLNMQKAYGNFAANLKTLYENFIKFMKSKYPRGRGIKEMIKAFEKQLTQFLKFLDFEIVQFLLLSMSKKLLITAWFKTNYLYVINERKQTDMYPELLLQKLEREANDESFREIEFGHHYPINLEFRFPVYFEQKINTIYRSPKPYKNIIPNSKLANKKLDDIKSFCFNYPYGDIIEFIDKINKYLDKIRNLNIKKEDFIDGLNYYKKQIEKCIEHIGKTILKSVIREDTKNQIYYLFKDYKARNEDLINYLKAVYEFYQKNPNYIETPNDKEVVNILNYKNGYPDYDKIAEEEKQERWEYLNRDYEKFTYIDHPGVEIGDTPGYIRQFNEIQIHNPEDAGYEYIREYYKEQERINNQNRYLNQNIGLVIPKNSSIEIPDLPPSTAQDRMNMEQQFVELPEPGVIPMTKTVRKTKKSRNLLGKVDLPLPNISIEKPIVRNSKKYKIYRAQKQESLPVPQTNGSLPIPITSSATN